MLPAGGTSKVENATEKMKDALRKYDLNLNSERRGADDIIKASDDVPRIKEIEVVFNRNVKHDAEEFARQLKDQEKGMNELTLQNI